MKKIFAIWILIFANACSDEQLDLPQGPELIVVEGWLTDQLDTHWVKVSRTTNFYSGSAESIISDAELTIKDRLENEYQLTYNPADQRYYTTEFEAENFKEYRLHIKLANDDVILSTWETLNPVPPIEEIQFDFFEDRDPDTGEKINVYYPIVISSDPIDVINNYRYKGFINGVLINSPEALILLSDEFNDGQLLPHHIPTFRLAIGDEIKVELHSISGDAFKFLSLLRSQTTSLGSSAGTAPAKLIGNLTNTTNKSEIVLGYFGVSSIQSATAVVIE